MKIHTVTERASRPRHAAGEIVWASVGNYLENPNATLKYRPVVILRAGQCQHWIAGLTTQPVFKTTGDPRVLLPVSDDCALCGQSYLWSPRATRVSRIDVRSHIGWISHDGIDVIERHMLLPRHTLAELRAVADTTTNTAGEVPAATL
jgi:hypothetical protein